jgi:tetratricopeptide (TPR) repeat protein
MVVHDRIRLIVPVGQHEDVRLTADVFVIYPRSFQSFLCAPWYTLSIIRALEYTMHDTTTVRRFSFDTAAVWLLGATAFLGTVLLIPSDSISFYGTKAAVFFVGALLAFIAFVVGRLVRGSFAWPPLALLGAVWLVPVAYALSALFSGQELTRAFFGTELETDTLGFMVLMALLSSMAALALRRAGDYYAFFVALALALTLALVAQLGIIIAANLGADISPIMNLVGGFTEFGMLLGLLVVLGLVVGRFLAPRGAHAIVLWAGIALSLVVLAFVNSVITWIMVGLTALALFIEAVLRRRGHVDDADLDDALSLSSEEASPTEAGRQSLGAPLVVLLISLFFLLGGSTIGNSIASSLGISTLDVRPSWQSTFAVGTHTFASSPLFGSGPGTFSENWSQFRDRSLNDTVFWNVDFASGIGVIPTSFVTTGIVGVIAWFVLFGFFAYAGVRTLLFRLPEDRYLRFVSLVSYIGAAYVLILAFFTSPGIVLLSLGFLMLGVFVSSMRHGQGRNERGIVFSKSPKVGFAIVFVLTLLLIGSVAATYGVLARYMGTLAYGEAASALSSGDLDRAESALSRSLSFAPTDRGYQLATAIGVERMRRIATDATIPPSSAQQQFQAALSSSVAAGLEATRRGPGNYQNWATLGGVYQSVMPLGIEGAYESAKGAYERAAALNPTSPVLPYVLAQLEIAQGNGEAAEAKLLESIAAKRDYIPAILLLSQLEIQLGKAAEALQAAEAAAYFAPNEPAVLFQVGILRSGTGDAAGAVAAFERAVELNPQYANARFFLGAMYATQGRYKEAAEQLRMVASLSEENAAAVADDLAAVEAGRNPFPASRLRTLGIPTPPVAEPASEPEA